MDSMSGLSKRNDTSGDDNAAHNHPTEQKGLPKATMPLPLLQNFLDVTQQKPSSEQQQATAADGQSETKSFHYDLQSIDTGTSTLRSFLGRSQSLGSLHDDDTGDNSSGANNSVSTEVSRVARGNARRRGRHSSGHDSLVATIKKMDLGIPIQPSPYKPAPSILPALLSPQGKKSVWVQRRLRSMRNVGDDEDGDGHDSEDEKSNLPIFSPPL